MGQVSFFLGKIKRKHHHHDKLDLLFWSRTNEMEKGYAKQRKEKENKKTDGLESSWDFLSVSPLVFDKKNRILFLTNPRFFGFFFSISPSGAIKKGKSSWRWILPKSFPVNLFEWKQFKSSRLIDVTVINVYFEIRLCNSFPISKVLSTKFAPNFKFSTFKKKNFSKIPPSI